MQDSIAASRAVLQPTLCVWRVSLEQRTLQHPMLVPAPPVGCVLLVSMFRRFVQWGPTLRVLLVLLGVSVLIRPRPLLHHALQETIVR